MVQCCGAGEEEGWVAPVLHQLSSLQHPDQKGCLPLAAYARDHGEHGWCPTLFMHGLEEWPRVKMAEEFRQYTAFMVGSMGVYEFLCMP